MEEDRLTRLLRERLDKVAAEPSDGLFDRIMRSVAQQDATRSVAGGELSPLVRPRDTRKSFWRWPGVAVACAALAAVLFVGNWWIRSLRGTFRQGPAPAIGVASVVPAESLREGIPEAALRETFAEAVCLEKSPAERVLRNETVAAKARVEGNVAECGERSYSKTGASDGACEERRIMAGIPEEARAGTIAAVPERENAVPTGEDGEISMADETKREKEKVKSESGRISIDEALRRERADERVRRRRSHGGASLYAAGFGWAGSNGTMQSVTRSSALLAGVNEQTIGSNGVFVKQFDGMPNEEQATLRHRLPVSVGIDFAFPVGRTLRLETGLTYTYLRSVSEGNRRRNGRYDQVQRLHYLGIPVALTWQFARAGRWSFYLRGGGMVERAVYADLKTRVTGQGIDATVKDRLDVRGVQFSVSGAAGADFRLARAVAFYVEPGVSYFFERCRQPESFRTEHPVDFSLRMGVRFDFSRR